MTTGNRTVRAIGVPRTGALDQLGPLDVTIPPPARDQVEVRMVASAVNPADLKVLRGEFAGRFLHARTEPVVTGWDVSGVVEAVGEGVTDLAVGDAVFGHLPYAGSNRAGAFAERVVIDRAAIARLPSSIGHDVAAAAATPGMSALQAMRDEGRLRAGGRVLLIGAAGGVGSLAVGIAKRLGAHVTAVASTYAVDHVRGLGADEVVDRKQEDPLKLPGPFELVFDAAAAYGFASTRHLLAPTGSYVTTLPSLGLIGGKLMAAVSKKRCGFLTVKSVRADLEQLATWVAGGMAVPIEARFPVRELRAALDRVAGGQVKGRIVVDVENGF